MKRANIICQMNDEELAHFIYQIACEATFNNINKTILTTALKHAKNPSFYANEEYGFRVALNWLQESE